MQHPNKRVRLPVLVKHERSLRAEITLKSYQVELLHLLVEGMTDKDISKRMHVLYRTTKWRMANLFAILNAKNRVQAAVWAVQHGIEPGADVDRAACKE